MPNPITAAEARAITEANILKEPVPGEVYDAIQRAAPSAGFVEIPGLRLTPYQTAILIQQGYSVETLGLRVYRPDFYVTIIRWAVGDPLQLSDLSLR